MVRTRQAGTWRACRNSSHSSAVRVSMIAAVLLSSLLFAAAHHVGPYGEEFHWRALASWSIFAFRTLAGIFFSVVYVYRGFGIAAGSHAAYDILVGVF